MDIGADGVHQRSRDRLAVDQTEAVHDVLASGVGEEQLALMGDADDRVGVLIGEAPQCLGGRDVRAVDIGETELRDAHARELIPVGIALDFYRFVGIAGGGGAETVPEFGG